MVIFEGFGDAKPCRLTTDNASAVNPIHLDSDQGLVIESWSYPGKGKGIEFKGADYYIGNEGLYRFIKVDDHLDIESVTNRIYVDDARKKSSLLALVSALAKLQIHGALDNLGYPGPNLNFKNRAQIQDLINKLTGGGQEPGKAFLSLECGYIATVGVEIVRRNYEHQVMHNEKARCIHVDNPKYRDRGDWGHNLMEMDATGATGKTEPILVDLDLGNVFCYQCAHDDGPRVDRHYLSADEFLDAVRKGPKPDFRRLKKTQIDPDWVDQPWFGWRLLNDQDQWSWYQRVFGNLTKYGANDFECVR